MKKSLFLLIILSCLFSCKKENISTKKSTKITSIKKTQQAPIIDAVSNDNAWKNAKWQTINELWLGKAYSSIDFSGKYKLTWTNEALYALVEIQDDSLFDQHKDPLKFWWDDDCVEVFIDEDNSGGEHQYNHNAFAYHVALDGNVVDIAPGEVPTLYNNHIESKRITKGNTSIWELKINIYNSTFIDGKDNKPATLRANKQIGFAIAYCDNDGSENRENFIGSIFVEGEDKNRGWIDASIFGTLKLEN